MDTPAACLVARPPVLLLGRQRDLDAARDILRRGRLLVVWGLGGLGKTSLIRALVTDRERPRTVEVRPPAPGAGLRPIAEAVSRAWGASRPLATDEAASAMALLDLAESRSATLFVDDAHWLEPTSLQHLMRTFAAYASRCRLLLSSRAMPEVPDLAECFLRLEPLDGGSMEALVRACRPEVTAEECARLVSAAAGSPWTGRCLATGQARTTARIADDLDPFATRALGAMRWIDIPISEEALDRIGGRSGTGRLLETRAFADRTGSALRLHDVARLQLAELGPPDPAFAELALAELQDREDAQLACAALFLAAALDRRPVVEAIVTRSAERILEAGLAVSAFQALRSLPREVALAFRLACAAKCGVREALAWAISEGPPRGADALVAWGDCMAKCARSAEARAPLAALARKATGGTALRAAIQHGRMSRTEADAIEALEVLALPHVAAAERSTLHLAIEARNLAYARRYDDAVGRAEDTLRALECEPEPTPDASSILFSFFTTLGRHASAAAVLGLARHLRDPSTLGPSELYLTALHALETGDLASARVRVAKLTRLDGHDQARFLLVYLRFRLSWVASEVEEARTLEQELRAIAVATRRDDYRAWARIATLQLAMDDQRDPPADGVDHRQGLGGLDALVLELFERLASVRRGRDIDDAVPPSPEVAIEVTSLRAQLEGEQRAARGDLEGAERCLRDARARAQAHHAVLSELDLMAVEADVCRRAGKLDRVRELGRELERRGRATGALRYVARALALGVASSDEVRAGPLTLDRITRTVRISEGRVVSLEQHELGFRILEELVREGGRVSKEHLARIVWERRNYDGARDDKRLQMAVRRLRVLIEADPATPKLLVTTGEGYALAGATSQVAAVTAKLPPRDRRRP